MVFRQHAHEKDIASHSEKLGKIENRTEELSSKVLNVSKKIDNRHYIPTIKLENAIKAKSSKHIEKAVDTNVQAAFSQDVDSFQLKQ